MVILTCIYVCLIIGWSYGYRFFGDSKSELGYVTMSGPLWFLYSYGVYFNWGLTDWWLYLTTFLCSIISVVLIRKLNPWGEYFPQVKVGEPLNKKDVGFLMSPNNFVAGFEYKESLSDERKIHWKMCGWIVRHFVYGLFSASILCVCFKSLVPLLGLLTISLIIPFVYRRTFLLFNVGDKLKISETQSGFFYGAVKSVSTFF